ncbi:MAG: DUF3231 family protein [Clostridia bacterium]|nr:DUF3231 family protein [Clostridia bacterium]
MPNIFEAVSNVVKTFVEGEPKTPLHVGEVMHCWTYITALQESIAYEEVGINTTTDNELKKVLLEAKKMCESQAERLRRFMQEEGVPLPEGSSAKPKSDPDAVPLGVRLSDEELVNGVSLKVASAIVACATGQSQSIRNDTGLIWLEFQAEQLTFGTNLKNLMRKRGWIKMPPPYCPPGVPKQ